MMFEADFAAVRERVDALRNPSPLFRLWTPDTPDLGAKVAELAVRLIESRLYLSDEVRNEEYVRCLIGSWFNPKGPMSLVYEVGRGGGSYGGVVAFQGILPGWKCALMAKIWERRLWGVELARQTKELLALVEGAFGLERIEIDTADLRMVRLGRMMGFGNEGVRERAFRWEGVSYDIYELARMKKGASDGKQESGDDECVVAAAAVDREVAGEQD
jgi:hypothetical protein